MDLRSENAGLHDDPPQHAAAEGQVSPYLLHSPARADMCASDSLGLFTSLFALRSSFAAVPSHPRPTHTSPRVAAVGMPPRHSVV